MKRMVLIYLSLISTAAIAKGEIIIRSHSLIQHGSPVILGDIVEVTNMDSRLKDRLLKLPLAAAPNPGEKIEFSSAAISGILRPVLAYLQGIQKLKIPNQVVVERSSHAWEQTVIKKELLNHWQPLCSDCQLEIDQLSLPVGQFENWTMSPKKELPRGAFSVPVEVAKDGHKATLWIQGSLVVRKNVPVAKRALFFGERLKAADFAWTYRDVTFSHDGVPAQEEIDGRRLKNPIRADDVLFAGMIEREKALKRGELARVVSARGDWEVAVNAIAQADADIGDTVSLKNPRTNKELTGTVISKGEVEIQ